MKHADLFDENCAIARSTGILGERWVCVIVRQSFNGARRFEYFQRGIGLARNVLTERLNWLVDNGIFERLRYAERYPRPQRVPTDRQGPRVSRLRRSDAMGQRVDRPAAPPVDLLHKPCGRRSDVRVVCSECGQDIHARDTKPVVGRGLIMFRRASPMSRIGDHIDRSAATALSTSVNTVGTQLRSTNPNLGVQSYVPSVSTPRERGGLTTEMRRQDFA